MKLHLALGVALASLVTPVAANDSPWNISGFASYLDPDSDRTLINTNIGLDEDIGIAAALGYRFNTKWEGRVIFNQWKLGHTADGYGVDGLYHFNDKHLYGIFGYKHADLNGGDDELLNVGLGKRFELSERLYFTAEALVNQSLKDSYNDFGVNIGLTYFFGERSKTVMPKPKPAAPVAPAKPAKPVDSDGDGVYDDADACPNTPMSDAVDSQGCTRYEMDSESVRLQINFANNDDKVAQHYYSEIERVAEFMSKYPEATVVIEGHTSKVGAASYNQNLSERRAKMVAKILVEHFGVQSSRVSHVGYGETQLLNDADTAQAHKENRRIEAKISGSKKVKVKR